MESYHSLYIGDKCQIYSCLIYSSFSSLKQHFLFLGGVRNAPRNIFIKLIIFFQISLIFVIFQAKKLSSASNFGR